MRRPPQNRRNSPLRLIDARLREIRDNFSQEFMERVSREMRLSQAARALSVTSRKQPTQDL
jgi:hypothetical protein